jgi:hypothetical protein
VFGPFLFIIAMNDLYHCVSHDQLLLADDSTLYATHPDSSITYNFVDTILTAASECFSGNMLALNEGKTQGILFSLSRRGEEINPVELLGFTLDSELGWGNNIDALDVKLSRVI